MIGASPSTSTSPALPMEGSTSTISFTGTSIKTSTTIAQVVKTSTKLAKAGLVGNTGTSATTVGKAEVARTSTTSAVVAGDRLLPVERQGGFEVGARVVIDENSEQEEFNEIAGFGSLLLKYSLKFAHDKGTSVSVIPETSSITTTASAPTRDTGSNVGTWQGGRAPNEGSVVVSSSACLSAGAVVALLVVRS